LIAVRGRTLNDILVKQIEILRHEPKCQKWTKKPSLIWYGR
jgi:hypothetical protein